MDTSLTTIKDIGIIDNKIIYCHHSGLVVYLTLTASISESFSMLFQSAFY